MFYIHQTNCVSPQQTVSNIDLDNLNESNENKLSAVEPVYDSIPPGILRRMGRSVRLGIGTALPLIKNNPGVDGIIIGTTGGMEDCREFLDQIMQYNEGTLTPTKFVQSSMNAVASQISLLTANKGYNITHVNRGLSFENAIIDIDMLIKEDSSRNYILGGVDEISDYNFNIDLLGGWYKREIISNRDLYKINSPGSIAGEGAAMFIVNGEREGSRCRFDAITVFNTHDEKIITTALNNFLNNNLTKEKNIDLFLSGENGDNRFLKNYSACEEMFDGKTTVACFKHMTGEFPTASSLSLWLAIQIINKQHVPVHMLKKGQLRDINNVLIYNSYHGNQHSFMLISRVNY